MKPNEARLRNMTYGTTLHVDVDIIYKIKDENGVENVSEIILEKIYFGKFPIMLNSDLCILNTLDSHVKFNMGECKNDKGGYFIIDGKEKIIYLNREVVTIRGIVPGEYITNVHAYRKYKNTPVNGYVRLLKLNPYIEYITEYFTLKDAGDEVTVFRFEVDKDGYVSDINQDHHRFITNKHRPYSGGISGP